MKKLTTIIGILILAGILVAPVYAHREGWGGHMGGPGNCWDNTWSSADLTNEQRTKVDQLERDFYKDTSELRNEIWTKSDELDILLNSSDPDPKEVRTLQKDISNLKGTLAEKRTDFELEVRKVIPESAYTKGFGRHMMGKGYGRHMMGSGYGHRGDRGPGRCW
jgi:zinc resistance-associated protein